MYCLVDFRNRPLYQYTFNSRENAREYIRKIKNNPLGATVTYRDGRMEYFENGIPSGSFSLREKISLIRKGCHIKYRLQKLNTIDGVRIDQETGRRPAAASGRWRLTDSWQLFMLGNRKFYSCLAVLVVTFSFSTWFFQQKYSLAFSRDQANPSGGIVLGASFEKIMDSSEDNAGERQDTLKLADDDIIFSLLSKIEEQRQGDFEKELVKYVKGRPMEDMAPYIAKQPRIVAAFLVGIAMKESKFGTYSPKLDGRDCHNYWGFKGGGTTASGGYTCFASPEEAIQVVGKRIARLVDGGRTNPSEMVVWKCGSTCSWDKPENVRKWIADVGVNFYKINSKDNS